MLCLSSCAQDCAPLLAREVASGAKREVASADARIDAQVIENRRINPQKTR
jgi:hypothetical protein